VVFAAKAFLYGAAMENKITGKESGDAIKRRRRELVRDSENIYPENGGLTGMNRLHRIKTEQNS
jgi:hypothetical protein